MTEAPRRAVQIGRRAGVAGVSDRWELRQLGRVRPTDADRLRRGLRRGWLTGVEDVRRIDGDWGPLYGRPFYREVFGPAVEPRDHARARASTRIRAVQRATVLALVGAGFALVAGWPTWSPRPTTELLLVAAAALAVVAGMLRLVGAMATDELASLDRRLVPPVMEPPEPIDWASRVAEDARARALSETTAAGPDRPTSAAGPPGTER